MWIEIIKMSLESLLANKTRSFLSMLGIIIGVATVIAVFAIGQGAQKAVDDQFQGLSANSIMVFAGRGKTGSSKLNVADAQVILKEAKYILTATGAKNGSGSVSYGTESESGAFIGCDENYFHISNLEIDLGKTFTKEDIDDRAKVAVLGSKMAEALYGENAERVGTFITISGKKLEVIGILKEKGVSMGKFNMDEAVFFPNTTAESSIFGKAGMVMLNLLVDSVDNVELAKEEVTNILRDEHRLRASQDNDFDFWDAGSMVGEAQDAARLMSLLLISIATITLLVSGIGIMNVMFVTVAERTKEIGIAKAIGGKRGNILSQFLLESVILSMIGGVIGVLAGNGIIYIVNRTSFSELVKLSPSIMGIVVGVGFSVLVGIFFGFYPALKASRLDPVDALRSE